MSEHMPAVPRQTTPASSDRPVATLLLAGGKGTRLHDLTARDSKPAVAFAGANRIIDFAMANAVRSGLNRMLVATQYAPHSLHHHLPTRWGRHFPQSGLVLCDGQDRFMGTADAARQTWDALEAMGGDQVLILAADHVYDMNYADLLAAHRASGAAVTVAVDTVPRAEARGFGVMQADAQGQAGLGETVAPPCRQVVMQAVRRVLRGDQHPRQAGPHGIRHRKVDDAVRARKRHGGLAVAGGQFMQARALSPRQQKGRDPGDGDGRRTGDGGGQARHGGHVF